MRMSSVRQTPLLERVHFGRAMVDVVDEEMTRRGLQRAFVLASRTLESSTDVIRKLEARLGSRLALVHTGISQHSPNDEILHVAQLCRDCEADLLVTIGGGSVVDAGKVARLAIGAGVRDREALRSLRGVMGDDGVRRSPPCQVGAPAMLAVATTLSAAEFSDMAGSNDPILRMKDIYKNPRLVPEIIVLDPEVASHTPQDVWVIAGARAVDHAVETVCSRLTDHYSNGLALHAIRLLRDALPESAGDAGNLDARLRCLQAAWLAADHTYAGIGMGASHGIGYVVGSGYDVWHGHTSAILLPAVMRYNLGETGYGQSLIAEAMGVPGGVAADLVAGLFRRLGLPASLSEVGVTRADFPRIASTAIAAGVCRNNPRAITREEDVIEILEMVA
jgi:maleylacetate reductase